MIGRIWLLDHGDDDRFASALRTGTWETIEGKDVRVSPLVMEWEKGSCVVPGFLFPGFGQELITHKHIFEELRERFGGIEAGPVEIVPPKWKRKKRKTSEGDVLTIWSEELHLVDVQIVHHVDIDWDRSRVKRIHQDGKIILEVEGGERTEVVVNREMTRFTTRRVPRTKGGGIFVKAGLLKGHSFFKVNQFPVWNLCTDEVRDFILEKRYTNIDFFEVGELF